MRSRYFLGLCLSTSLTAPAAAETWYKIAETDSSIDFADEESIRRGHGSTSLMIFRGMDSESVPFVKAAVDIKCAENQFRVNSTQNYGSAKEYLSTDSTVGAWETIADNSIAEAAKEFACDGGWRENHVSDPFAASEEYWYYYYYY